MVHVAQQPVPLLLQLPQPAAQQRSPLEIERPTALPLQLFPSSPLPLLFPAYILHRQLQPFPRLRSLATPSRSFPQNASASFHASSPFLQTPPAAPPLPTPPSSPALPACCTPPAQAPVDPETITAAAHTTAGSPPPGPLASSPATALPPPPPSPSRSLAPILPASAFQTASVTQSPPETPSGFATPVAPPSASVPPIGKNDPAIPPAPTPTAAAINSPIPAPPRSAALRTPLLLLPAPAALADPPSR